MAVRGVNFHPNLVGYYSPFPSLHFLSLPLLPSAFSEIQLGVLSTPSGVCGRASVTGAFFGIFGSEINHS